MNMLCRCQDAPNGTSKTTLIILNNEMYLKRDKGRIKKIVLDLHDVIADSRWVVLFEYGMPLLSKVGNP